MTVQELIDKLMEFPLEAVLVQPDPIEGKPWKPISIGTVGVGKYVTHGGVSAWRTDGVNIVVAPDYRTLPLP